VAVTAAGPLDESSALLLRPADRLRFVPDAGADGPAPLTFRVWDQANDPRASGGRADVMADALFGPNPGTAVLDLVPVLDLSAPAILTPVGAGETSDPALFSALLSASRVVGENLGVAVVAATGPGTWEYRPAGGVWAALPKVSAAKALLLDLATEVRFAAAADPIKPGTATLSIRAWDRTTGAAGERVAATGTAFSKETERVTVAVKNAAPVMADRDPNPALPPVRRTAATNNGMTVSSLLGTAVTDGPGSLTGVALVAADETDGRWEYSTGGGKWVPVGAVADTAAVLLAANHRVRFIPAAGAPVGTTATVRFKAWDRTAGAAGDQGADTTAPFDSFSLFAETAEVEVVE
jgi:hypothetical protein